MTHHPWLHRLAVATACVALLPIVVGATVTTLRAGMAFLDWPTSDGWNMLAYPWLNDLAAGNTGKFVEHGHRLAGIVVGVTSIALAASFLKWEERRWVRALAVLVLAGVVAQGVLGGVRVRLDDARLALFHGAFGAVVFALMSVTAMVTGRSWVTAADGCSQRPANHIKPLVCLTVAILFVQYLLGGQVRHLGRGLHEHLGFAFLALLLSMATAVVAFRSGARWLRGPVYAFAALLVMQMLLGAGAWVTRFGFASADYVAVQNSTGQIVFRTAHMVVGMLAFMMSVLLAVRVFRLDMLERGARSGERGTEGSALRAPGSALGVGGAG